LAAQTERRIGAGTQAIEFDAWQRLALPRDAARRGLRLGEIGHQRRSIGTADAQQQPVLLNGDIEELRPQAQQAGGVVDLHFDRLPIGRLQFGQEPVQRAAETKSAGRDPHQLGAAAVQLQFECGAVRDAGQQCGQRGQGLRGH